MSGSGVFKRRDELWREVERKRGLTEARGCISWRSRVSTYPPEMGIFKLSWVYIKPGEVQLAVITDSRELAKILRHLVKTGKSPPGLQPSSLI